MNKKGAEMSMQVIVIAVIVLLIAAILIYIAVTKLKLFDEGVSTCRGNCESSVDSCVRSGGQSMGSIGCNDGQVCCITKGTLYGNT